MGTSVQKCDDVLRCVLDFDVNRSAAVPVALSDFEDPCSADFLVVRFAIVLSFEATLLPVTFLFAEVAD